MAFRLKNNCNNYNLADFLRSKDIDVANTINPSSISFTVTEATKKMIPKLKIYINKYIKDYIETNKEYEGEGIQQFYETKETLYNYLSTKHTLPTLLESNEEEEKAQ